MSLSAWPGTCTSEAPATFDHGASMRANMADLMLLSGTVCAVDWELSTAAELR
jgi:hypothetical protein